VQTQPPEGQSDIPPVRTQPGATPGPTVGGGGDKEEQEQAETDDGGGSNLGLLIGGPLGGGAALTAGIVAIVKFFGPNGLPCGKDKGEKTSSVTNVSGNCYCCTNVGGPGRSKVDEIEKVNV
jgi:hypothetical protein